MDQLHRINDLRNEVLQLIADKTETPAEFMTVLSMVNTGACKVVSEASNRDPRLLRDVLISQLQDL